MRIHFIQHVPFEYPGSIVDWATENNFTTSYTKIFEGVTFPSTDNFDMLVVLGGPMAVYEEDTLPWIKYEKAFINNAVEAGKKVFGICLGAQLIANVLGEEVYPHIVKEIGWWPVQKMAGHPLTKSLPAQFITFHWHGDTFKLPAGATHLFKTEGCLMQGFALGRNVAGLQFHMEVKADLLNGMTEHERNELTGQGYVQTEETIQSFVEAEAPRQAAYLKAVLDEFIVL